MLPRAQDSVSATGIAFSEFVLNSQQEIALPVWAADKTVVSAVTEMGAWQVRLNLPGFPWDSFFQADPLRQVIAQGPRSQPLPGILWEMARGQCEKWATSDMPRPIFFPAQ